MLLQQQNTYSETVTGFFTIPDGPGERKLSSNSILPHSPKLSSSDFLRFAIVGLKPKILELFMVLRRERGGLEDLIKFFEVLLVE